MGLPKVKADDDPAAATQKTGTFLHKNDGDREKISPPRKSAIAKR